MHVRWLLLLLGCCRHARWRDLISGVVLDGARVAMAIAPNAA